MRLLFVIFGIIVLMPYCQSGQNTNQKIDNLPGVHKVVVAEVIHTTNYTYLRVKENEKEMWLAVPLMQQAKVGATYYYDGGYEMKDFESKELKRKFSSVYFLEGVRTEPTANTNTNTNANVNPHDMTGTLTPSKPKIEKQAVKVTPAKNGITIAELYKNKKSYVGKTVRVKGQVTKFTPDVMNKNWLHIQDGTDFNGSFDLTVSSNIEVKVGDTVTLEGKITLDKDLGFGYFYDVLMEDAKTVNK